MSLFNLLIPKTQNLYILYIFSLNVLRYEHSRVDIFIPPTFKQQATTAGFINGDDYDDDDSHVNSPYVEAHTWETTGLQDTR